MNSLRSRLILGFSLVAVVPLTIAMALLAQRIQGTVRAQAAERLGAAIGNLNAQLGADGERIAAKLDLLARDPALKRLYLVGPPSGPDLRGYLADQQFLLDLDYLWVADTSGRVIADGAAAAVAHARAARPPVATDALAPAHAPGRGIVRLAGVPALALDASAPILYRDERAGVVRGGVVLDAALLARLRQTSGVDIVLYDADGRPVASSFAGGASPEAPGAETAGRVVVDGQSYLARRAPLALGAEPHAQIAGFVSTAAADDTVLALRLTSVLLGLLGVALAVVLGIFWSLQVSRPVERLASFSERISRGEWDEPLALESVRELQTLVTALDRMRSDLRTYRSRLQAGERQAAYGEMARRVAHEIKNPLTPIAVSVADLQRSFERQAPDFPQILDQAVRTIGEEVRSLKQLLQEFSDFGRFPPPRLEAFDIAELFADVKTLFAREVADGRLAQDGTPGPLTVTADRAQLRQMLINLIQNGLEAAGSDGRVGLRARVDERPGGRVLEIRVSDTGPGLSAEQLAQLFVPGFTTKEHGSGIGLSIVERIVSDHRGTIETESAPGRGVTFLIRIPTEREA